MVDTGIEALIANKYQMSMTYNTITHVWPVLGMIRMREKVKISIVRGPRCGSTWCLEI